MLALMTWAGLRSSGRSVGIVCAAVALLATTGCKHATSDPPDVAVAVTASHPQVGPISEEITSDAILSPLAQAAMTPKVTSPIRAVYVQRGARVHRGQLLVTLEDLDLRGAAEDSQGSLEQARATYVTATQATIPGETHKAQLDVAEARAALDVANRTAQERKRLLAEGAIAGRDTDTAVAQQVQAQATYDIAVQHLNAVRTTTQTASTKSAQGQLTSAEGRYKNAAAQVGYANLRSPISGVVTDRPYFVGETAPAGAPVVTVMDTTSLLAKLHLSQAATQKLTLGDEAEVNVPGVETPVKAKVSFISPALDAGSTTVEVWLKLANADGKLKAGTPVHTTMTGTTVDRALTLPLAAILPTQDGSIAVMVVGPDHVAHKRAVKVGIQARGAVQVISGITARDTVITEGSYGLDDGTKVTLTGSGTTAGRAE